jgi:hypothetical protein
VGNFQLISLSEVNRPARKTRESGAFSLIRFPDEARAGMGSALPTEGDGKAADFSNWLTPMDALAYAAKCVGPDRAGKAVWQLLSGGMIDAVADSSSRTPKDRSPITKDERSEIPRAIWAHFAETGSDLWVAGYARFYIFKGNDAGTVYRYFRIRLNPDQLKANLPSPRFFVATKAKAPEPQSPSSEETPVPADTANKGGRPRKEWWDDFWIEICRQIWVGDLQPKTQADLERAMIEWVENHRTGEVGETTIKAAAKRLFKAWDLGSKT